MHDRDGVGEISQVIDKKQRARINHVALDYSRRY